MLAFICTVFVLQATAQLADGKPETLFNRYQARSVQEKLFMHVDRTFYLAGDILWCKLYVVDASSHQPLDLSKVAYVEVLDANNTAVIQSKIALDKGNGNGSISLPVTTPSGNYKIRAYTNWMKNTGPDYFFEKLITIVNTQKRIDIVAPVVKTIVEPDIRFFPEGGNLVSGMLSRMACKVVGANGRGPDFTGTVVDENNIVVANFESLRFGMCSFDLMPVSGHTYRAVLQIGKEKFVKELPEIFAKGYVMRLNPVNATALEITAQTNSGLAEELTLLVHTRQELKAVLRAGTKTNGVAGFTIDPAKLGDGISQFVLVNSAGKPVCERLYFKFPSQNLAMNISGNVPVYPTRSRIDLGVQPSTRSGKEPDADMSVAVYKVDELQSLDENNIQNFLWLSSDLRGQIESPSFYFSSDSAVTVPAMDNLMLTQGWRRFKWENIFAGKPPLPAFPPEHNGHIVTGKVVSTVTGKPVDNIETYLSVPGFNTNFRVFISDSLGKVKFDFKNFRGASEIIVQTNPVADTLVRVEINNPFSEQFTPAALPPYALSVANENLLRDKSIGVQVQNMYLGTKLKRFTQTGDTSSIFGTPESIYFLDDFVRFVTMEEVLREYVGMMNVQYARSKYSLLLIDNFYVPSPDMVLDRTVFQTDPLILVDGVPVFTPNKLMTFDPLKMRKLEMYNKRFFYGSSFFSGVMNFTTYKGDLAGYELDSRALVMDYEGLQLEREFYSPVYDVTDAPNTPDHRTLLYWSHDIVPDAKGERHVQFYTSDKKGNYVAVFQGLTPNGVCGSKVVRFEVR